MRSRVLGLDTGTNSLGWAVVDRVSEGNYELVDKGVVVFTEGVKREKGIESSKAAERTAYRASRKKYFRRRLRKIEVLRTLIKNNLCPYLSEDELELWNTKKVYPKNDDFLLWQRTNENELRNPYYYRHLCLNEELDLSNMEDRYMLGRAMYHLAQRRGFLSNRLDPSNEDETGKVKTAITDLSVEMEKVGCDYLGDYFFYLYQKFGNQVRIRNRYTDRENHYKKEFEAICRKQKLDVELMESLSKALYFQRPLKSQRKGVGKCTFEPAKPRCSESHPAFEEFRMLCFLNNIKVKTPADAQLRKLNEEERNKIRSLFYRKSQSKFDFEDIAKKLAGRNNYSYIKDPVAKPYQFNYRMSQGVSGCPFAAQMKSIFGEEWKEALAETYTLVDTKQGAKSLDNIVNDVWNVLYSFTSKEKLKEWALEKLQLSEEQADAFSNIKLSHNFAALSLKAIRNILYFLRQGFVYSHATLLAKVPDIVPENVWNDEERREFIVDELFRYMDNSNPKDSQLQGTVEACMKDFLYNNFDLSAGAANVLYHPSMIEVYPDAKKNKEGLYQLGSPRTNSIRNPMAMRSLHVMRKLINRLLREKIIDENTEIHVEYARELNDANKRKAIELYQRERNKARQKYEQEIKKLYKEETGLDIVPSETDILKFQLWEEQNHRCVYTGKNIGVKDFLGNNPKYDIEHTIPRSVGGDSTQMNLTLCENRFNREVKRTKLPSELSNHEEILTRIDGWREKYMDLQKQMDKCRTHGGMDKAVKDARLQRRHKLSLERDYYKGKYERFMMTEVPEGFGRRQGAGIGLISKYAGLYLRSLFHKKEDRNKSNVYNIKGITTSEFRKMWGLQSEYEKKSRVNHVHHCIDAITIACIGKYEASQMSYYYRQEECYRWHEGKKPQFQKPWASFTEDVLGMMERLCVVHDEPNHFGKKAKRRVVTANGKFMATGDSVRGSLHNETYYGAIMHDDRIRYVVRRALDTFTSEKDLEAIVDEAVKEKVKEAVRGKVFKQAIAEPIYMNEEKGVLIKKVRCFANAVTSPLVLKTHRDLSRKEYKQSYFVTNNTNYSLAIYEGKVKNRVKREAYVVTNLEASHHIRNNEPMYPAVSPKQGLPLMCELNVGRMVLLYENNPSEIDFSNQGDLSKRLYKVTGLNKTTIGGRLYGVINLRHHQEARPSTEVKSKNGAFKENETFRPGVVMLHTQFKGLIVGKDFSIDVLGHVEPLTE